MELRQVEHFLAVARCGSFTAAAQEVHVVQSALSASIRKLEAELGTPLFERTTRRVALTEAGRALVRRRTGSSRTSWPRRARSRQWPGWRPAGCRSARS